MSYTSLSNDDYIVIPEQDSGPILGIKICDLYEIKHSVIMEIVGDTPVHIDFATCLEYMMRDYTGYLVNLFSFPEDVAIFMMKDLPVLRYQVNNCYLDCAPYIPLIISFMVQGYTYLRNVEGLVPSIENIYKMHDYTDGHFSLTIQQRINNANS